MAAHEDGQHAGPRPDAPTPLPYAASGVRDRLSPSARAPSVAPSPPTRSPTLAARATPTRLAAATAVALALLVPATPTHASALDLFGYGARGPALGGATVASATGPEAVYYNPAGLGWELQPTMQLGFQMAHYALHAQGEDYAAEDSPALSVGFSVPLPFGGVLAQRLTLGVALVLPQNSIMTARLPAPTSLNFPVLDNRANTLSLQAALGIRLTDWLAVGAGAIALAGLEGSIDVAPNDAGLIGSVVRDAIIAQYAPVVGVRVRPVPGNLAALELGAVYRGESTADFDFPIRTELDSVLPFPIPELVVRGTAQYDPEQVTFGATIRPFAFLDTPGGPSPHLLTVELAATWRRWSTFPNPLAYTALPDGAPDQPAAGFRDTWTARLGIESELTVAGAGTEDEVRLIPRLGMVWDPTPVPEQTAFHNFLDSDRLVGTVGLGVFYRFFQIQVTGQVHGAMARTHTKTDNAGAFGVEGTNPGFPSVRHHALVGFWSVSLEVYL